MPDLPVETYAFADEILRIARVAVAKAQEESRRMGVPNVYCINGRILYETPTGELSATDPYVEPGSISGPKASVAERPHG
jgi:hypothetical protein